MNQQIRPKVTIGLPVYNGEKFIRKNLDSLLSQSYPYFELIISDNASTDSTSSICKEYEKKDKRIRYIRQKKNMGAVFGITTLFYIRQKMISLCGLQQMTCGIEHF